MVAAFYFTPCSPARRGNAGRDALRPFCLPTATQSVERCVPTPSVGTRCGGLHPWLIMPLQALRQKLERAFAVDRVRAVEPVDGAAVGQLQAGVVEELHLG